MTIENQEVLEKLNKTKIVTPQIFVTLLKEILKGAEETLLKKEVDYGESTDALSTFNKTAQLNSESPVASLWGMASKHLTSVLGIINDIKHTGIIPSEEYVSEKVGDLRNYLILLEIVLHQERAISSS